MTRLLSLVAIFGLFATGPVAHAQTVFVAVEGGGYYGGCPPNPYYPTGTACGQVWSWTEGTGAALVETIEDDLLGHMVAIGVDVRENPYVATTTDPYYFGMDSFLLQGGKGLAFFPDRIIDVDVAADGSVYIATEGGASYGCNPYYEDVCGQVFKWHPDTGTQLVMQISDPRFSLITGIAVNNSGDIYLTAADSGYYAYDPGHHPGTLLRNGVPVATFDEFAVDVDVAPDGRVYVGTARDDYGCIYGAGNCGGSIFTWNPVTGGPPTPIHSFDAADESLLTGVAVDGLGNFYYTTESAAYYSDPNFGKLYKNGALVTTFDEGALDVDCASFGPVPAPAPGPKVYLASVGDSYDCYYGYSTDCGSVHSWEPSTGALLKHTLTTAEDGSMIAVAADTWGNVFYVTGDYYSEGQLFKNGVAIATLDTWPADVEVGADGQLYIAVERGAYYYALEGLVYTWDQAAGLTEVLVIPLHTSGEERITGVAADSAGHIYVVTQGSPDYGPSPPGNLYVDGQSVASFSVGIVDIDVAPDGTVYMASDWSQDCESDLYYDTRDCSQVLTWSPTSGPETIFSMSRDHGRISGVAVDREGNYYFTTGTDGYYSSGAGVLYKNGFQVAVLPFAAVDVDAVDFALHGTWLDLGNGLAGAHGVPSLAGSGTLLPASSLQATLTGALENTSATLVSGVTNISAPFKGGVLVPSPDFLVTGLSTNGAGSLTAGFHWPPGTPAGQTAYLQFWIDDPAGPEGMAASNAVSATAP